MTRIEYRFEGDDQSFREEIQSIQFLYRSDMKQDDIPVLYVEAEDAWVRELLLTQVLPCLSTRECSFQPFAQFLSFLWVVKKGELLKIGGWEVEDISKRDKQQFIQKIKRLTYESR